MYITEFTVKGKGFFPFDMLRRDCCYPADGESAALLESEREVREIVLRTRHSIKTQPGVTFDRWESFGWQVIACQTKKL